MGGKIAEPMNAAELTAVAALKTTDDFWVGFNDILSENTFVLTSDASTDVTMLLSDEMMWGNNEPNDTPGDADCVRFKQSANGLADYMCESETIATCICEFPLTVVFPPPEERRRRFKSLFYP